MSKEVKIVVGANYGDEGKGMMVRHFSKDALQKNLNPIVIFHNGTAQRGHTVDYTEDFRHVYHHFGSATAEGVGTYYADTFMVHPMEFHREYLELTAKGIIPSNLSCDIDAQVITPYDMLVDHMTEDYIALQNGKREYGSCGFGSWCASERTLKLTIGSLLSVIHQKIPYYVLMRMMFNECKKVLEARGVDIERLPQYSEYFKIDSLRNSNLLYNFKDDVSFFEEKVVLMSFSSLYKKFDSFIFENGQGLGLDKDVDSEWCTTSHTGLYNPTMLLKDVKDFNAEVCYVTRSYLTRHGEGELEEEVRQAEINRLMEDKTNVRNNFQGSLRYGFLEDKEQKARINKDWSLVAADNRFTKAMAVTHCNEFESEKEEKYMSNNKFSVVERK